ncbi:MAG: OmpH family outer membrane protein [Bacteroidota bacterium]|jgi:outer membrane protein|nr:OmpH family outer membrane protein [Bacteroidota bacterium]
MKRLSLFLVGLCILAFGMTAGAQNLKIGYVDSQKIFEGLPEAQDVQKQLDAQLGVWQDSLDLMAKSYMTEFEGYQAQEGMMSEDAKKSKQQELIRMQQEVNDYRTRKFGQTGDAARMRQSMLQPLQNKVLKAIEEVAKEEKLNFVFDKIEDAALLLYAESKFDYTFKVLDYLKRGSR